MLQFAHDWTWIPNVNLTCLIWREGPNGLGDIVPYVTYTVDFVHNIVQDGI